ncbi:MAG: putative glycoside hydrolase [Candidatus Gracilibacteria bacterium]|nr:putative glycoside hydrolase [Candidatus Gracilibacteria bacterium]
MGSKDRYNNLLSISKNTGVNSVTIDVKTVTGYTSFDFDNSKFGKIKPVSDGRITEIKEKIKELHKKGIYVVGRIVVFKDNLLTSKRPDLAYKWSYNKNLVWNDYSGNKYLDASAKEVWDYNAELASQAYEMGFDEINFDYVRFPSDGKISKIYAPFSKDIIAKYGNLGKIKVLDNFSTYFSKKLRDKHPEIILSADVFGLVTRGDMNGIGQNLESFLLNFDYVGPMTYPSHYGAGTLGFSNPDNHPYEIIKMSIQESNVQINRLNKEIELAKLEDRKVKLSNGLEAGINTSEVGNIDNSQIRLWLQGFTCTRCKGATPYNSYKFKEQTRALTDMGLKSFWVWNSGSRYYQSRYK